MPARSSSVRGIPTAPENMTDQPFEFLLLIIKNGRWSCCTSSSVALFFFGKWIGSKRHIILFSLADDTQPMVQFEHYLISNSIGYVKMLTFWLGRLFRNSLAIDRVGSLKLISSIYYNEKKK